MADTHFQWHVEVGARGGRSYPKGVLQLLGYHPVQA